MVNTRLCRLDEIPPDGCREFEIAPRSAAAPLRLFVVRRGVEIFSYVNSCPHTGVNLDWQENQFLDLSGRLIQCSTHGALFRIRDGFCIRGPCAGRSLKAVPAAVRDEWIELELP